MSKSVVVDKVGGPEVLKIRELEIPILADDEVLIRNSAIGINYMDIYYRAGLYTAPTMPLVLGFEGVGIIEEVGVHAKEAFPEGTRVAYATGPIGAYTEFRVIKQKHLIGVPDFISDEVAAASLLKGMTAHYLLRRTFYVRPGNVVLVHAAAGAVGGMLCQLAKHYQATVIGTVSSKEKAEIACANGCDYPIIYYNRENLFSKDVMEITNGQGVTVVYDSVGKNTFHESVNCLTNFGLLVSFGQSSGPVPPIDLLSVAGKSIFITRPSLFDYKANRMELVLSANEVFDLVNKGVFKIDAQSINIYNLEEAVEAHQNLQDRRTAGPSIFKMPNVD